MDDADAVAARASVRRGLEHRWRAGLRLTSAQALVAVLCASALGPVAAAALGAGAVVVAGVGVLGSVGANVLTEVVMRSIDRVRSAGRRATQEVVEDEIAVVLQQDLAAGGDQAARLRGEIAAVLRRSSAVEAAVEAAVATGDARVHTDLARLLTALGAEFAEFGFVVAEVRAAAVGIQETLRRQDAEHRADRDRARESAVLLRLMREELAVIERRTRAATATGGTGPGWEGPPYRGLWPFEADHAPVFFGRERLTAELVTSIAGRLTGLGMLVVSGASGAGKSSLLRAGLLPAVARGLLVPGSATWPRVLMTPTRTPLAELAAHLAVLGGMEAATVHRGLAQAPDQAHLVVRQAVMAAAGGGSGAPAGALARRLLLIVDQFEEIFELTREEEQAAAGQRAAFIHALYAAAATPAGNEPSAVVVLGLRGDFWDRCAAYPQVAAAMRAGPFVVGPMTDDELRRVIVGPAGAAGLEIEPGLIETVLGDLRGADTAAGSGGAVLPLLSQAMLGTWQHRESGRLTTRGYGLAGGVTHAVQTTAEAAYRSLTASQAAAVPGVLRRLTVVARDGQLARRRVARGELYGSATPAADVDGVLDAFTRRRLLVLGPGTVEIAHDVLLRAWPRLRAWLDGDVTELALYSQLVDDAAAWLAQRRDPSYLYRGARLTAASQAASRWRAEPDRFPTGTETAQFLQASQRVAASGRRLRRTAVAGLAVLTVIATAGAIAAGAFGVDANRQRAVALSRELAAESLVLADSEPTTAWRLAAAAWRVSETSQARDALGALLAQRRHTLVGHDGPVAAVAFNADGTRLASAGVGDIRLWDTTTGRPTATLGGHTAAGQSRIVEVLAVAFSPDGRLLASGGADRTVRLWDAVTGRPLGGPLTGHTGPVGAVAFSPDGSVLASAGRGDTIRLWDPRTGRPAANPIGDVLTTALAVSPDGRAVAGTSTAPGAIELWDAVTGQPTGPAFRLPQSEALGPAVASLAFSPDGRLVATAQTAGDSVRIWDARTGRAIGAPIRQSEFVGSVTFSPDGTTLAVASGDTIQRRDPTTGQPVGEPLTGHTGFINAIAFSPDGALLASAGNDWTVRLWEPTTGQPAGARLAGHTDRVGRVAFAPDGRMLASSGLDGTLRLWDPVTGRPLGVPLVSAAPSRRVAFAFSPDGKRLATASAGTVQIWDPRSRRVLDTIATDNTVVRVVAFSPDGSRLVTAGSTGSSPPDTGAIRIWDTATGRRVGSLLEGHTAEVGAMLFAPDGSTLASSGVDVTVRLWRMPAGQPVGGTLTGPSSSNPLPPALWFSPDGTTLSAADHEGTLRTWDAATGRPIGEVRFGTVSEVVAFSPDGSLLAETFSKTMFLRRTGTGEPAVSPVAGHDATITAVAFSPDGRMVASGDQDGTIRIWSPASYLDPVAEVCAQVGPPDRLEWLRFGPGGSVPSVCP